MRDVYILLAFEKVHLVDMSQALFVVHTKLWPIEKSIKHCHFCGTIMMEDQWCMCVVCVCSRD